MVFEAIRGFLAELLNYEEARITLSTVILEDLEAELAELMDLMLMLEQEFSIQWTEEDLKAMKTVGDVVEFVETQI